MVSNSSNIDIVYVWENLILNCTEEHFHFTTMCISTPGRTQCSTVVRTCGFTGIVNKSVSIGMRKPSKNKTTAFCFLVCRECSTTTSRYFNLDEEFSTFIKHCTPFNKNKILCNLYCPFLCQ